MLCRIFSKTHERNQSVDLSFACLMMMVTPVSPIWMSFRGKKNSKWGVISASKKSLLAGWGGGVSGFSGSKDAVLSFSWKFIQIGGYRRTLI